jgi:hypothetical protein
LTSRKSSSRKNIKGIKENVAFCSFFFSKRQWTTTLTICRLLQLLLNVGPFDFNDTGISETLKADESETSDEGSKLTSHTTKNNAEKDIFENKSCGSIFAKT